jgi:hypothetical protein
MSPSRGGHERSVAGNAGRPCGRLPRDRRSRRRAPPGPGGAAGLVLAHGLWERSTRPQTRTQVALCNLATIATILIGVATLYLAFFLATATTALLLLPNTLLADALGHPATVADHLTLACLISSLATVGAASPAAWRPTPPFARPRTRPTPTTTRRSSGADLRRYAPMTRAEPS